MMKIFVKAKPGAKTELVEKIDSSHFVVKVKEPPRQGKANEAIAKALAGYFNLPAFGVKLISGFASKEKTFEIL